MPDERPAGGRDRESSSQLVLAQRKKPLLEQGGGFLVSGADVRPDFSWNKRLVAVMGYRQ